jgi:predicted AAA+ superfamily ATPase
MKRNLPKNSSAPYVSLDNIWLSEHRLAELIDDFVKKGGEYLFADEVHKYPDWSQELKNAYDIPLPVSVPQKKERPFRGFPLNLPAKRESH